MAKKKHHMTKYEYEIFSSRNNRRYGRSAVDSETEEKKHIKLEHMKHRKRSDTEVRKHLRNIQRFPEEFLTEDDEA
jgi:hypothetical protein